MAEDGADTGDGATGGGSGETESKKFVPPSDGSWIPKVRHDEAVNAERARLARVEAELAALKQAQAKPADTQVKRYTRAELNAAVAANQITSDQSDEMWATQIREDAKREAKAEVNIAVRAERAQERVDTDLEEYKRLDPTIMEEGSESRQRVQQEFNYLVELGNPRNTKTELQAVRAALGPIDKLRTAKSARRETESHEETGSAGQGSQRRSGPKTAWDALENRQKAYYESAIRNGLYKDKAAVEAELKFTRKPNSPRRSGARG